MGWILPSLNSLLDTDIDLFIPESGRGFKIQFNNCWIRHFTDSFELGGELGKGAPKVVMIVGFLKRPKKEREVQDAQVGVLFREFDAETKDRAAAICQGIRQTYFDKTEFCHTIHHLCSTGH